MLNLDQLAVDAARLATQARNARCCDALRPCRPCMALRRNVRARRLVLDSPGGPLRPVRSLVPVSPMRKLAS